MSGWQAGCDVTLYLKKEFAFVVGYLHILRPFDLALFLRPYALPGRLLSLDVKRFCVAAGKRV